MGISLEDFNRLTSGEIVDMLTEQSNDYAEYDLKATQEDIDQFFG